MCVFVLCVYVIGVFVNVKIIIVSRKDKGMTWKMDICNSIILIVHYLHIIVMHGVTLLIKDLHLYTGSWFCYVSKILIIYGNAHVTGFSFIVSILKCVMIVHWKQARHFGDERVKQIFFWITLIYPVYMLAMFHVVKLNFLEVYNTISQANRCLGESDMFPDQNPEVAERNLHHMCELEMPPDLVSIEFVVYIVRTSICWIHVTLAYSNFYNITEAFIYYRIFYFMWR